MVQGPAIQRTDRGDLGMARPESDAGAGDDAAFRPQAVRHPGNLLDEPGTLDRLSEGLGERAGARLHDASSHVHHDQRRLLRVDLVDVCARHCGRSFRSFLLPHGWY